LTCVKISLVQLSKQRRKSGFGCFRKKVEKHWSNLKQCPIATEIEKYSNGKTLKRGSLNRYRVFDVCDFLIFKVHYIAILFRHRSGRFLKFVLLRKTYVVISTVRIGAAWSRISLKALRVR